MRTPPFLMAAALLFWGLLTDFLPWAAIIAIILESSRLIKYRWEFSETDLNRIWDLCTLLFLGAAVLLYTSDDIKSPAFAFPQWLPFIFFPMMAAQAFGTTSKISARTFSWFLRRRTGSDWAKKSTNISYLYFSLCLLGASATKSAPFNNSFNRFYIGLCFLVVCALFANRPRRLSAPVWISVVLMVSVGGYAGQRSLRDLQAYIEGEVGSWMGRFWRRQTDAKESRTNIGQIGRLKLSGKIILRVEPDEDSGPPGLLREASFISYRNESWFAKNRDANDVPPSKNDSWTLLPAKNPSNGVTIHQYVDRGAGILALPIGTFEITNLPCVMKTNTSGVVRVDNAPGLLSYTAHYGPGTSIDSDPTDTDLHEVPEDEEPALRKIVHDLKLDTGKKSFEQKRKIIARFFETNFTYSTYITSKHVDKTHKKTPLQLFLEETHSGHCEYFATATVLLARMSGISARYATGYAVDPSSRSGNTYLVRERHGHAWALVWDGQRWHDFDTTPPSWDEIEEKNASMTEAISDFWARIWFEFSKWRYGKVTSQKYLILALVPLILILAWRIIFNKQRKRVSQNEELERLRTWPGLDSDFYLVEKKLAELGFVRTKGESIAEWRRRVENSPALAYPETDAILTLHYRYRFDPKGISAAERQALSQKVRDWLNRLNQPVSHH